MVIYWIAFCIGGDPLGIFRNNVYAMITHGVIVALFYFLYTFGHLVRGSIEALIMLALISYFFMGRMQLHIQRSTLKDFWSVVSVAIFGVGISVIMALQWRVDMTPTPQFPRLFVYFHDLFITVWLNEVIFTSPHKRLLFVTMMLVASATPTVLMWLGLLSKRKGWNM